MKVRKQAQFTPLRGEVGVATSRFVPSKAELRLHMSVVFRFSWREDCRVSHLQYSIASSSIAAKTKFGGVPSTVTTVQDVSYTKYQVRSKHNLPALEKRQLRIRRGPPA